MKREWCLGGMRRPTGSRVDQQGREMHARLVRSGTTRALARVSYVLEVTNIALPTASL